MFGMIGRSALVFAAFVVMPCAAAPCRYEVVAVLQGPSCPPQSTPATPLAINDHNEVVGYYRICGTGSTRAFHWSQKSGFQTITMPGSVIQGRAYDINNHGVITGTMGGLISPFMGYVYQDGVITPVGLLLGGTRSEALAINDAGVVTGYANSASTSLETYTWSVGVMTGLNPMLGVSHSEGLDINADGIITGWRRDGLGQRTFAYVSDGASFTDLGPIPGGISSEGWTINRWGDVAGLGRVPDGSGGEDRVPFRFMRGKMEVGTLLAGYDEGFAYGINARGCVVGFAYMFSLGHLAFIWDEDGLQEATPLVCGPPDTEVWELYAINDAGWMVGGGRYNGVIGGLVLRPVLNPTDLNHDGFVDGLDLAMLLGMWGSCRGCAADLDLSGVVNGFDLAMLLGAWG